MPLKVLFAVPNLYLSEPLGTMMLMAVCKKEGHEVSLTDFVMSDITQSIEVWQPDVVAYSAMTVNKSVVRDADLRVRNHFAATGKKVFRIMGGPFPTFSPEVIDDFQLDAICQGDGDYALPEVLRRIEKGESLEGIPNIALTAKGADKRELVADLDKLPFPDRECIYSLSPYLQKSGLRSFIASRGCPYFCTYCFNHAYNEMFRECGSVLRRRSVENLLAEIEMVVNTYKPVKLVRFGDDTFSYRADDWLEEFSAKYKKRINVPFYCLMRSNTLDEDTARLLRAAGCYSISMSIETGNDSIRNGILKRNISEEVLNRSFEVARKHGLKVYANTLIAIPGTTIKDDFDSLEIVRKIRPTAPSFGICCPYPGTELWRNAISSGILEPHNDIDQIDNDFSVLNCYSDDEKNTQLRITSLGPMYCTFPKVFSLLVYRIIRSGFPVKFCQQIGNVYQYYRISTRIFPQIIPKTPKLLWQIIKDTSRIWAPSKKAQQGAVKT